uniref:ARAD1D33352p n=1 Tax=Blastobotrys adeninivorans TaxID=409370 RepID=A0A060TC52_BLAAD
MDRTLDEIIASKPKGGVSKDTHRRGGRNAHRRDHRDPRARPRSRSEGLKTIMITNLFYELNEEDLESLFSKVGEVKKVKIQYDRSGRSEGVAWVTFGDAHSAREAIELYNGKPAAGQRITITIAHGYGYERFSGNDFSERLAADRERDRRGTRRNRSSRRESRRPRKKTQEELDAELDAYMNPNSVGNGSTEEPAPQQASEQPEQAPVQESTETAPTENAMALD